MGFFKKLIDQVKKEYPNVGNLIDSANNGTFLNDLKDSVTEAIGMGSARENRAYYEQQEQEQRERKERLDARKEALKTVYRDPADIEMAAETRRQINDRIKGNLRPRNFLWGPKETLDELVEYIIDNSDKELDELYAYIESKGVRYDRTAMENEMNQFYGKSSLELYRRNQIEEFIFLDRMTSDEILELLDEDLREMEEIKNNR